MEIEATTAYGEIPVRILRSAGSKCHVAMGIFVTTTTATTIRAKIKTNAAAAATNKQKQQRSNDNGDRNNDI